MSRGELMRRAAFAGVSLSALAPLLAACGGDESGSAADLNCSELRVLTYQGYTDDSVVQPFNEKYNTKLVSTYISSNDEQLAKLAAGGKDIYHVSSLGLDVAKGLIAVEGVEKLDTSKLTNWEDILPFLTDTQSEVLDGEAYIMPWSWDINPFLYSTKTFGEAPTDWEILFDKSLKGQIGVWDDISTLYIPAVLLGFTDADPNHAFDMTDEELAACRDKLIELKPNLRTIWADGGDLINLMANGEVKASLGWTFIYNELKKKGGAEIGKTVLSNHGPHAWFSGFGVVPGEGDCHGLAYEWANWATTPEMSAKAAEISGYSPANPNAADHLSEEVLDGLLLKEGPESLIPAKATLKLDPVRRDAYVQAMNEFKAAVQ